MASAAEEDVDYESDPEELKRSLGMRRREASDDEGEGDGGEKMGTDRRAWIHSDELEGQGGVAEYDDDNEELDSEDLEEEEADEEGGEVEEVEERICHESGVESRGSYHGGVNGVTIMRKEFEGDVKRLMEGSTALSDNRAGEGEGEGEGEEEVEGEEKGENEPFAVPTAGAFYMHDDRFRDNNAGRHRRMRGGRRLWESKDERRWGHDKFEELSLQERHNEEGRRTSKGRYRGRGKVRGTDRGYARGNRFRDREYNYNDNQNHAPKSVKGRGPKRYEPMTKNNSHAPSSQSKSGKHPEKVDSSAEKTLAPTSTVETKIVTARKQVFASSLNSASPPFYPSGSSNKGITITQNKDVQSVGANKNLRKDESFSMQETSSSIRGKSITESAGNDRLYKDESNNPAPAKPLMNLQMQLPRSSTVNYSQPAESKTQSRSHITGSTSYQSAHPPNHVNRVSSSNQPHGVQQGLVHRRHQHAMHAPGQQFGQHSGGICQTSSPPKSSLSINLFEGEMESPLESTTLKSALVGKGKGTAQGNGRGSFLHGSSQVMGATGGMSVSPGDPNFPATPAFLPVMQFGGQHPGGIGVPAVGMAFPGYVAQPKLGLGNSEMTWLPVLTGTAGPSGAQYCSSYIAVDGSYHSRQPGQISSASTSSKDDVTNKPNNEGKPSKKPELANDEFGHRQNKSRRYSEMNLGQ